MAKEDRLHTLVHAMRKSEKRHFLLMSNVTQKEGEKRYVEIFKYLQDMEVYDEALLKKKLKKAGFSTKNLAQDRSYLYHQMIKSLCWLNRHHDPQAKARELLDATSILMTKGLYGQAASLCRRAKSIVESHQLMNVMPDVLLLEWRVLARQGSRLDNEQAKQQLLQALADIESFVEADFQYREVMELYASIGKVRSAAHAEAYDAAASITPSHKHPIHTQIRQEQTKAIVHFAKGETQQEYACMAKILEMMENAPKFKAAHLYEYVVFQSHMLRLTKYLHPTQYDEYFSFFLAMVDEMDKEEDRLKALVYSLAYSTETVRLVDEERFAEGVALIPKIEHILEVYNKHIAASVQMTFTYKFAYFHYRNGNLTEALTYVNHLLNHYQESDRKDVFMYARILSLVIHFDLGNEVLVSYNGRSLRAFLKKRNVLQGLEGILLDTIRQLSKAKTDEDKKEIITNARKHITHRLESHPKEQGLLTYFDVLVWLDEKEAYLVTSQK